MNGIDRKVVKWGIRSTLLPIGRMGYHFVTGSKKISFEAHVPATAERFPQRREQHSVELAQ